MYVVEILFLRYNTISMRVRKHVNPLNIQEDFDVLPSETLFTSLSNVSLEIGCAHGEFIINLAKKRPRDRFIGFEIRKPLARKIQSIIKKEKIQNLSVFYGSSNKHILEFPDRSISNIFIFFPDPWFKNKHHKRRIISKRFLNDIKTKLKSKNKFLFQTDVLDLFEDTKTLIEETSDYAINYVEENVNSINSIGVLSYHEQRCIDNNWPIYRIEFSYTGE